MNNSSGFDEKTEKYVTEFRNLYNAGNFRQAVIILDVFKSVPEELHERAANAIIKLADISPHSCYRTGLKFLSWKRDSLPLNSIDRERLLSTILDIATDPDVQHLEVGELWELAKIDDPRVFETLVRIYKNDNSLERKQEVVYGLGTTGKEAALPILLDYIYRKNADLSEEEINLLEKYPVLEKTDLIHTMNIDDRDRVVTKFIKYLQDKHDYNDVLRTAIAHTLAILYPSNITSIESKELIKASANVAICYGYDEHRDDPVGHIYLKEFVNFGKDDSL